MNRKRLAIIQARMSSTRLPGKVLKELCGKPILYHVVERARQTIGIDQVAIATSTREEDDCIEIIAKTIKVPCFRGSETDVLARFFEAAKFLGAKEYDRIIRLTADNPFVDPIVLRDMIVFFESEDYHYVSTSGYPLGLGAEIFDFQELEEAYHNAEKPYEREHVTPYMYQAQRRIGHLASSVDRTQYRFTVDTPEDFAFAEHIYRALYHGKHDFYLDDILNFLNQNPDVMEINCHVHQKLLGE